VGDYDPGMTSADTSAGLPADSSGEFFTDVPGPIRYEGPDSDNPLAFRWYDAGRMVGDRTMAEHLRFAVAYWHSFAADGADQFGSGTWDRPWLANDRDPMDAARSKMVVAFEFFEKLGAPYFCFHDLDIAPEGGTFAETCVDLDAMVDEAAGHMERTGVKLLWGTANLFSRPRFAAGAATNPDPELFARAAAQVRHCLDATHRLGGANYVLWGGREGYDTILNTDVGRELDQLGRFLNLVVEHKHTIGFEGTILIEPKPHEPTKHQYDHDSQTIAGFLRKYDLIDEVKLNIEVNHATLAGHDFVHEVTVAVDDGLLGSIDANRGDGRLGWDTDQFPTSVEEMSLAMHEILRGGGLGTGGVNFDAKMRRQSVDRIDLFHAHIGGMDVMARSLLVAHEMLTDGALTGVKADRYRGWDRRLGADIMAGRLSLVDLDEMVADHSLDPVPVSGRQEALENLVNRYVERVC